MGNAWNRAWHLRCGIASNIPSARLARPYTEDLRPRYDRNRDRREYGPSRLGQALQCMIIGDQPLMSLASWGPRPKSAQLARCGKSLLCIAASRWRCGMEAASGIQPRRRLANSGIFWLPAKVVFGIQDIWRAGPYDMLKTRYIQTGDLGTGSSPQKGSDERPTGSSLGEDFPLQGHL